MLERQDIGVLEVTCDAPPYSIVQAANAIGVERPEDVRWENLDRYVAGQHSEANTVWDILSPRQSAVEDCKCSCKEKLPKLSKYRFTYSSGDEVTYSVGQCPKCKKVYWTEG